jgi:tetraacyldisaccharide 4'-kinase
MVSLLLKHSRGNVAVLSRGYGRKTKGYFEVSIDSTVQEVGDEPLEQKRKFPEVLVAVCEDRGTGIETLLEKHPEVEGIILDDAFQHRYVLPSSQLVLTPYDQRFTQDYVLPAGNLRESAYGAERATAIVVTKSPLELSQEEKQRIREEIASYSKAPVFFSTLDYSENAQWSSEDKHLVVTGIENPTSLYNYLTDRGFSFEAMSFPDHHNFTAIDIQKIEAKANTLKASGVITTAKDVTRLSPLWTSKIPLRVQEIETVVEDLPKLLETLQFPAFSKERN